MPVAEMAGRPYCLHCPHRRRIRRYRVRVRVRVRSARQAQPGQPGQPNQAASETQMQMQMQRRHALTSPRLQTRAQKAAAETQGACVAALLLNCPRQLKPQLLVAQPYSHLASALSRLTNNHVNGDVNTSVLVTRDANDGALPATAFAGTEAARGGKVSRSCVNGDAVEAMEVAAGGSNSVGEGQSGDAAA